MTCRVGLGLATWVVLSGAVDELILGPHAGAAELQRTFRAGAATGNISP